MNKNDNNYLKGVNNVRKSSNSSFNIGPYLAGLIEADGYIGVHDKNSKAKKHRPRIVVVFNKADKPLAEKLSSVLQVGNVRVVMGYVKWEILAKQEVLKIINLINGYMRTPKIEALHRAINWINEYDKSSINCLGLDLSPIDSNSWLAGFTDGRAFCFNIIISNRKKNNFWFNSNFKLKFNIVSPNNVIEELVGSSYFLLFSKICEYFKTNLISKTTRSTNTTKFTFVVLAHNSASQDIIMEYFKKFPLFGINYWGYKIWCEARLKALNKSNLQSDAAIEIKFIKEKLKQNPKNILANNFNLYFNYVGPVSSKRYFTTVSIHKEKSTRKALINKPSQCTNLVVWGEILSSTVAAAG